MLQRLPRVNRLLSMALEEAEGAGGEHRFAPWPSARKPRATRVRMKATGPPTSARTSERMPRPDTCSGRVSTRRRKFLQGPHRVAPLSVTTQLEQKPISQAAQAWAEGVSAWLKQ